MPCDYSLYPPTWFTEIRPRILARAGEVKYEDGLVLMEARCEGCGVINRAWIIRTEDGYEYTLPEVDEAIKVILTIAHLDHDPQNCADENLRAWCQKCHLTYDARLHAQHARLTREQRSGQLLLEES